MAEASVFIGLTASVDPAHQAIALSGLFQAANIGMLTGLAASSAVLGVSLQSELDRKLVGYEDKDKVNDNPVRARQITHNVQIIKEAVESISYVLNLKGRLRVIVIKAYVRALEYTHGT
jgi:hypothetical protein